jgi:DNA polymerase-4
VRDPACIESMLCSLCERVCWRARKRGVRARTVTLKLRYADFQTLTRSRTFAPTCSESDVFPVVRALYAHARQRRLAIRLLGIALSNLEPPAEQLPLFHNDELVQRCVDEVRERFGFDGVRLAMGAPHASEHGATEEPSGPHPPKRGEGHLRRTAAPLHEW